MNLSIYSIIPKNTTYSLSLWQSLEDTHLGLQKKSPLW